MKLSIYQILMTRDGNHSSKVFRQGCRKGGGRGGSCPPRFWRIRRRRRAAAARRITNCPPGFLTLAAPLLSCTFSKTSDQTDLMLCYQCQLQDSSKIRCHGELNLSQTRPNILPHFFDQLFLIRAYLNPKSRQARPPGALPAVAVLKNILVSLALQQ